MARIKSKDTKPEWRVRRAIHAAGLRYLLHDRRLPGKPDLVFPSRRLALFVHGCFWHRHRDPACPFARLPKTRLEFWLGKLEANAARDLVTEARLREMGWNVAVVWECEVRKNDFLYGLVERIKTYPVKTQWYGP